LEVGGVEPELQKPGQKEREVTEKLYAAYLMMGKNGLKEEEASAVDFFWGGGGGGEM
jgi:hypothetical protein